MRAIELDFAHGGSPHRSALLVLLAAGVLVLAAVLLRLSLLSADVGRLASALDDAQRAGRHERRPLKAPAGEDKDATARELVRANLVVASLNRGWSVLFKQIESVQVANVTLLAVQAEAGNARRLRLTGEARRLGDALAYVKRVANAPGFENAHLVSHEVAADGPAPAVRFALVVDWVGQP